MELSHLYDDIQILEDGEKFDRETRLRTAVPALLSWFAAHARVLPWREDTSPYRVWVSEIMLQQTRVEAVKPYFERFMKRLPDIRALAEADEETLLKLWEGLGYYSRVRNLARAAAIVTERYGGELPGTYEELLRLPGIGSYTAGAIASIAFGQKKPAVDGNVLRVVARVTADRSDIAGQDARRAAETLLEAVMPDSEPGTFNQAMMEVGATVCIPRGAPDCAACPFFTLCLSRREGLTEEIPVKKAAKARRTEERTVLLVWDGKRVLVRKREASGLLAGLWEFPNTPGRLDRDEALRFAARCLSRETPGEDWEAEPAGGAEHIFSHVEWRMQGYLIRVPEGTAGADAADMEDLETRRAIPGAFRAYLNRIRELAAAEAQERGGGADRN